MAWTVFHSVAFLCIKLKWSKMLTGVSLHISTASLSYLRSVFYWNRSLELELVYEKPFCLLFALKYSLFLSERFDRFSLKWAFWNWFTLELNIKKVHNIWSWFVICHRMEMEHPNLKMNGHQSSTGKGGTPASFLRIHHLNQRTSSTRWVINFC